MSLRARPRLRRPTAPELLTALLVAGAVVFTFLQLQPGLLFADTTPAGGDMGAHVWGPAFLRDHLLPSGRITGWTPDWYAGFPAYVFYMVVPSLAIVALDVVLPYGVAFKLVTVAGVLALPVAAYALGRLARLPFPGPGLLAVATVPFLFDRSFSIFGGNIASTLAGEFAFSISLAVAVVFVGVVLRGLDDGRHRALAAGLLGLCALCHLIPAIFALVAAAVAVALRPRLASLRWIAPVLVVGGAVTSFWTVPFLLRHSYMNDMGWEKYHEIPERLLPGPLGDGISRLLGGSGALQVPGDITLIAAMALLGAGLSIAMGRRLGVYLSILATVFAVAYVVAPQGRLWNARLLPFWYLCLYLLAALAVLELCLAVATLFARGEERPSFLPAGLTAVAASLLMLAMVALPLRALPFGSVSADGTTYRWFGIETTDRSFVPDWARWNYSGYERKEAYPEFRGVVDAMGQVGADEGCGRAMWEYEPELDRYGTPMALMLLPYFTDGCIGSMEGLYFEASSTTPFHFLNQSELSTRPSSAQRDLPYRGLDVAFGVRHLQLLGVKYYLAKSDAAIAQADVVPELTFLRESGPWRIYEVAEADLVVPLDAEPAVVDEMASGGRTWLDPAVDWYMDPERWNVFLASDGPPSWQRVGVDDEPATRSVPRATVTDVETGTDRISFTVDRPGTPVLVKSSYFPNWQASGAEGPWRVAPNLMVVVPTDTHVELRYGTTSVEWLGWLVALLGVVGLVVLARKGAVPMPTRPEPPAPPVDEPADELDEEWVPYLPERREEAVP
jgi:hypothetical protein